MQRWAARLQGWQMHQFTAALLEAGGPLKLIGAQLVFISQPLFSGLIRREQINALADMLEEPEQTRTFIQLLREEETE